MPVNAFFPPLADPAGITFNTLNLTVLDSDLHCPTVTWSPSFTRKHGEMCAGMFECLFSYL
ncbi:hypothetical protein HanIR_Chr16g0816541 [Helianthus annuus]|nr:hypothetical protein HanIR_Chr16g0816541 [Helianthus annuus]